MMLRSVIHGCLIALGLSIVVGAFLWSTDPVSCVAMLGGAAILYLPVIENSRAFFEQRADDRLKGASAANQGWFVKTLREFEHDQEGRVIALAERTGRAEALLGEREAKLSRMIGHKDSKGRFSKAPAPTIEGEAIEEG